MLLFGAELSAARRDFLERVESPVSRAPWVVIHLVALTVFVLSRARHNNFSPPLLGLSNDATLGANLASFAVFSGRALRVWAPFQFWRSYGRRHRVRVAALATACAARSAIESAGGNATGIDASAFAPLFALTAKILSQHLTWGATRFNSISPRS